MYLRQRTNINELYLDVWLFTNSHLCQFIEIIHKIYKHIIQVENKNVGLKEGGGGTNIPLPP